MTVEGNSATREPTVFFGFFYAKSKSKADNSKPKSPPPVTICYTNVRGLRGNFTDLEAFTLKNNPDMTTSWTLISNCLAICRSIARMLVIRTALVFMLRAIFRLLERLLISAFFILKSRGLENIMECGDFIAHNIERLCHSHTSDVAGLFCQICYGTRPHPDC